MDNGNGRNGIRGGGINGPVEADEFDSDWYTNITNWRDEVVKDRTEGRVVSDDAASAI
jgi:hypothetical protein